MLYFILKIFISAVLIATISELAKRSSFLGALLASLPLTSILAMIWLYIDTKDLEKVTALSYGIFWVVIPSLLFFLAFPLFLKWKENFWFALSASIFVTGGAYWMYTVALSKVGIRI